MPFVFPILHRHLPCVSRSFNQKPHLSEDSRHSPRSPSHQTLSDSGDSLMPHDESMDDTRMAQMDQTATHLCEISRKHTSNTYQTGKFGMGKRKRSWYWEQKKNSAKGPYFLNNLDLSQTHSSNCQGQASIPKLKPFLLFSA